ncbi:MAG: DUF305 domain-containing protein [Pseudomonadota bacterium]
MTMRLSSLIAVLSLSCSVSAIAAPPIVQPGAPGAKTRDISVEEASKVAETSHSPDDVVFLQEMIPHHFQALEMAKLVKARSNQRDIVKIAAKIDATQADEIKFMRDWLVGNGYSAPDPAKHGMSGGSSAKHHAGHEGVSMERMVAMGMATPQQMKALANAEGQAFDRLFIELMSRHHKGAIDMVTALQEKPGSLFDPVLLDFATDIVNEQAAEIEWMNGIYSSLSPDPRAGLKAGLRDAGEAVSNLKLVASIPKPQGFFDPDNIKGLPPLKASDELMSDEKMARDNGAEVEERSAFLSFSNTDMAFFDDKLIVGNYHGFNIYQLSDEKPELVSSVICPGGQGDVSVVGNILIMSVEDTRGRVDCGVEGVQQAVSSERFMGIRIFDISDLKRPRQVGQVQTCRGSHTHSVVASDDRRIVVYNSGIRDVRDSEELPGCIGDVPGDQRTALFRIDVIEIPLDNPLKSRIVDSPAVFADKGTGSIAGLWSGGNHGEGTQETQRTDQCHDITVFPDRKIAAGACSGNGIILDISNPLKPKRIDDVVDNGFAYWHSATFSNDGKKVLFTDEWGGGSRPRCRASDPMNWGANAIYDIVDGKLEYRSHFKIGVPQSDTENCVAHNGSILPVPGRDIFVQAWYQGGMSIIDFTDSKAPKEIAFFDRGPVDEDRLTLAGYWSAYYFNGRIYGTEIIRGLDVFELSSSEYLTENEIAAAALADFGSTFNPQQQFPVTWPAVPVVALSYLDQMARDDNAPMSMIADVRKLLARAEKVIASRANDAALAEEIEDIAKSLSGDGGKRAQALRSTLMGIAKRLI